MTLKPKNKVKSLVEKFISKIIVVMGFKITPDSTSTKTSIIVNNRNDFVSFDNISLTQEHFIRYANTVLTMLS